MTNHVAVLPRARGGRRGLHLALAALLVLPSLAPISRVVGHWLGAQISVIVRGAGQDDSAARRAVGDVGGRVTRSIHVINGVTATVPADSLAQLRGEPGVLEVSPNAKVHLQGVFSPLLATASSVLGTTTLGPLAPSGTTSTSGNDMGSLYNITQITGAQSYWSAGYTGQGVDVAVIDSGAVPVDGLRASGKLVFGPDLSFDSQAPNLANLDGFGHGTHLGGIIAGRDSAAQAGHYAGDTRDFLGMAPDARIVSIKVADSFGNTDVSQVLAAIDWVVQHHADPGFNIRVVNMSFGTDSYQSYVYDPLTFAAETAWHAGVVVVAATGNSGLKTGVMDPADDPYVIAVGSSDPNGTATTADDTVSTFSAGGDGYRNPDLVAPGAHVVSLRDPGSYIDSTYPTARYADRFFRGSGTSQAAAVVSGAAALLLSQNPLLTPDQVKNLLTSTATPLSGAPARNQGAGELNLRTALTAVPAAAVQAFAPSTGTGSLEGARGSLHLSWGGVTLQGEEDIFGSPVNTSQLAQQLSNGGAWNGGTFNGVVWSGQGWGTELTSDGWSGLAWNDATWTASSWSSNQWSSNQWSSNQWSSNQWSSNQWSSNQWSSNQWSSNQWSSNQWSSADWN